MSNCRRPFISIFPPCPSNCPEPTENTFQNGNLAGVGVFDNVTAGLVTFRGIQGDGTYINVALDSDNKTLVVSLNEENISGGVPLATETVAGKLEVATQAETVAGTADDRIVTPKKLAALTASTTQAGLATLATDAATQTGTSTTTAVTPAGLKSVTDTIKATRTVDNAAARGAAVPDFIGQVLVQKDTQELYISTATTAGAWVIKTSEPTPGGTNGQIQYNNGGLLGGIGSSSWNGSTLVVPGSITPASTVTNSIGSPLLRYLLVYGSPVLNVTTITSGIDDVTLTTSQAGVIKVVSAGTVALPASAEDGTPFVIINGSGATLNISGNQSDHGNVASASEINGYDTVTMTCISNQWVWTSVRGTSEITGA